MYAILLTDEHANTCLVMKVFKTNMIFLDLLLLFSVHMCNALPADSFFQRYPVYDNYLTDHFQNKLNSDIRFEKPVNNNGRMEEETHCGYKDCYVGEEGMLNVHLVPHTHDDVGWLKTIDQYYYGSNSTLQNAEVQYILDTVVSELRSDPKKRFIYVEVAFFARWWEEQTEELQAAVRDLVNQGRLEFILGGWCMEDEASTHYNAMIDQHTLGFQFLKDNFGDCGVPKIGWQIDPFGHSREQASMFAQFGFDGLFFGRLDYQDKEQRIKTQTMEEMWQGSANLGDAASLFTGVNYNGYGPPPGFQFDVYNTDEPIKDNPKLQGYNVDERVNLFIDYCKEQAQAYNSGHIMLTMGSDFQYSNAHQNYKNMDKLIKYVNERQANGSKVNAFYSTPSCYLYAVNRANRTYSVKHDDFFPYASDPHAFWTGYFTSRPALKGYVRSTNNFLQACQHLNVLSKQNTQQTQLDRLDVLRKAMGVAQHHDAVSGTERQHVANDYALRLQQGIRACQSSVADAVNVLLADKSPPPMQEFCQLVNISYCQPSETLQQFTLTLYNPLARPVEEWTKVPVTAQQYTVLDNNLKPIKSQVVPILPDTQRIPERGDSKATGMLHFKASLPPMGLVTYFVQQNTGSTNEPVVDRTGEAFTLENQLLRVSVSGRGMLSSLTHKHTHTTHNITQALMYYKAYQGSPSEQNWQPSGAYIFRPNGTEPVEFGDPAVKTVQGPLVQEIHQTFSPWATQVIRLYVDSEHIEMEWTVGPIPFNDDIGKEVISRYTTQLDTNATFYTDSNGREILQRRRNYRPTWKLNNTEPVAGNYYPINSRIYIQDESANAQLTVLSDRSQGGSSINDGQIEIMLHRRCLIDDGYGAGEPLNETGVDGKGLVVRGTHYVWMGDTSKQAAQHRELSLQTYMSPVLMVAPLTITPQQYKQQIKTMWSGVQASLPQNVHLLTLQPWRDGSLLVRLEHLYESHEDPVLSLPANVSLAELFSPFNILSIEELALGANQPLSDVHRLVWNRQDSDTPTHSDATDFVTPVTRESITVTLTPMQIRTFQVSIS